MKMRMEFLKVKIFCVVLGYMERVFAILIILVGVMLKKYMEIVIILMLLWILKKSVIVKSKGCLQIIKTSKGYQLSMCKSFPGQKQNAILRSFLKSFQDIFDEKTLKKLKGKTIYINTHSTFCRGILKLLSTEKTYREEDIESFARQGNLKIREYTIRINKLQDRKNLMLASAYPIWPSKEQLDEFEEKNQAEKFYELRVPIELFDQMNLKK